MRYTTDLLFGFARALDTPELDGSEQQIVLPSQLVPVVSIPAPLSRFPGFLNTLAVRTSFTRARQLGQVASSAAGTGLVCTFSSGLWRVYARLALLSNFTQASDGTITVDNVLQLLDPNGNISELLKVFSINAVAQWAEGLFDFLFTEDGWQLQLRVGATGVGQTQELWVTTLSSRLS